MLIADATQPRESFSAVDLPDTEVPVEVLRVAYQLTSQNETEEAKPQKTQTVMLTSLGRTEGKTIIMHHLARALARLFSLRVLVLNLRHEESGFLPTQLGPASSSQTGIETTSLPSVDRMVLRLDDTEKFTYLQTMLPQLRERYNMILIESPALHHAELLDPVVFSTLFDLTILVFQQHMTPSGQIKKAIELFHKAGTERVALLINQGSVLSQKVSRWNLPARLPRLLARLRVLWTGFRGWWGKRLAQIEESQEGPLPALPFTEPQFAAPDVLESRLLEQSRPALAATQPQNFFHEHEQLPTDLNQPVDWLELDPPDLSMHNLLWQDEEVIDPNGSSASISSEFEAVFSELALPQSDGASPYAAPLSLMPDEGEKR